MMIKARKMIRALTIEERTKELKNVYSANDNLKVWKGIKSRLSDKQIDTVIQLRGINHNEFNNVIQNLDEINDEQTLQKLDDIVENSNWFKTFNEIMNMDMSIPADYINSDLRLCLTNFVKWGIGRIYTVTEQFDNITIDTGVYREIEKYLYDSLFSLAAKVLVYKFNKEKNNNKEGRYTIKRFIIEKFTNYKEVENFYCDYPVLARRLSTKIDYISNNIIRMLENINDNFEVISDIYKLGTTKITSVNCGKGDTHNKGNSVCILRIGNTEIVYKPYRDELGKRYNQFIETYNKYVDYQKIYVQKNVYFKDFTVCEYIHNKQCEDKYEIHNYYNRIGQMLYILNICGSNDMHCENIIAYKGYPVIVDYETIIGNYDYNKNATNAYDEFVKKFSSSVINIGFLPVEIRGLLLGGLNNQGGTQSIEHEAIICKDDESILFEKQRFELKSNKNIPILDNEYQEYYDYISDILSGFEKAFRIFYCNKEIINELKVTFSGSQARVVLQATQNYVDIAEFSSHPNYLYDMLDLEKLFENVINSFFDVTGHFLSEINDMINGDIPIFYANANEKTLIDSTGMRIEDFFSNTIIERIESKTEELAGIYEEQKKYLLYYFGCGQLTNKQFWDTQYLTVKNEEVTNADNLLLFLEKRIEKNIILAKNEETLTWLTMENNNLTCVFSDVYEGFGGLAWYIINAKKMNYKNSVLDKYEKVIEKMLLNKYTFWGDESLGVCRTAGNEIGLLISFYKFDKDVRFEEKIAVLLEFIKANMNSNQIKLSVLEVAQMINVLFEVYDALDNYEALLLMNNLGEYMLRELKKYGYIHMFGEEVFHIGTVINALKVMSDVTENEVYRYEYNDIMEEFLSGTLNDNQYNVMEYSYNICSGELLRVLESLMMIGDKKYYSNLIELCQSISEKALDITFDNDTLYEGTCAALSLAIQINDKAKVKYYLETLFNRYKIYNDIKVVDAPIFPKLGLKNGYLGVAYAVMRGISFINNGENK